MNITTTTAYASSSAAYSVFTNGLDIGPEIEWNPEHLALSAWLEHVPFAFWLIKVLRPACFVELGTERGISYAAFCQAVDRFETGSSCYAIDTWRGDEHSGQYDESVYHRLAELNDRRYRGFSSLLRTTFADALAYFADGEIDLLHIDGLHTYDAVSQDFRTWRSKLSDRAIVLFHDTNVRRDNFGVWRLWRDLTAEFPHFEFVHGHGLGIIGVGEQLPAPLRILFERGADFDSRMAIRGVFASRGAAIQRAYDLQTTLEKVQSQAADAAILLNEIADLKQRTIVLEGQAEAAQGAAAAEHAAAASAQAEVESLRQQLAASLGSAELLREQLAAEAATIKAISDRLITENTRLVTENVKLATDLSAAREDAARQAAAVLEASADSIIDELKAKLAIAEARCIAFQTSTSWRLTTPLRAAKIALTEQRDRLAARSDEPPTTRRWSSRVPGFNQTPPIPDPPIPVAVMPRERAVVSVNQMALLQLRILIVAELSLPQCKKYRVDQKHDMIEALGWDCTVVAWQDVDEVTTLMQTHSVVIFYRVPAFPDVLKIIQEAVRLGLPHYFELDDLIFDLNDYAANPNLIGLDPETTRGLFDGAVLYRQTLAQCRNIIASTPYLEQRMHAVGGGLSLVIENALDSETMRAAACAKQRPADNKIRIIYGSGTRTHDADFALVAGVLKRVTLEHDNVEVVLVGELEPPKGLLVLGERLKRLPACPYPEYLALLASCDIAIAPLIAANFNEAKSNIKFLEAAAMGVPAVCSPRSAFAQAIHHNKTGFLAESTDEWYMALTNLINDPALRRTMAENARHEVLINYSPDAIGRRQILPMFSKHQPPRDPRLHILQVNILCSPQTFGGATVVMEEMARHLHKRSDTRVSIFTSAPAGWLKQYELERDEWDGIPMFRIGIQDRPGWLEESWDESAAQAFREVLRALRPQVVHFHAVQGIGAATMQVCREEGIPYVVTLHDAWWVCERQFLVTGEGKYCGQTQINMNICADCVANIGVTVPRNLRLRQALDGADLLLTPSEHWRRFYVANRFLPARVVVNENGIPLPLDPKPNQGPERLRFGFVAGAEAVKGFPLMKRVFEALDRSDWELVLVNHGLSMGVDSYKSITWQASGTIRIVPPYKAEDRDNFYDSIDVLLFPSQWPESFGLTVREALARNKWVIATDQGGAAEAIQPGVNGTLIPITDAIAPLRQAVEALLDRQPDLMGWINPSSGRLRDFAAQAGELRSILASVAARSANRQADAAISHAAD